jgi:hypothetical protein
MNDTKQASSPTKGYGYRDLLVWQKGIELAKRIYEITRTFPSEEKFGLVSQMRRAVVSVPSNIAEGHARGVLRRSSFSSSRTSRVHWRS